jgi:hypothetical protein
MSKTNDQKTVLMWELMAHKMQYRSYITRKAELYVNNSPSLESKTDAAMTTNPNQGVVTITWTTDPGTYFRYAGDCRPSFRSLTINNFCGYAWEEFLGAIKKEFKLPDKDHSITHAMFKDPPYSWSYTISFHNAQRRACRDGKAVELVVETRKKRYAGRVGGSLIVAHSPNGLAGCASAHVGCVGSTGRNLLLPSLYARHMLALRDTLSTAPHSPIPDRQ